MLIKNLSYFLVASLSIALFKKPQQFCCNSFLKTASQSFLEKAKNKKQSSEVSPKELFLTFKQVLLDFDISHLLIHSLLLLLRFKSCQINKRHLKFFLFLNNN